MKYIISTHRFNACLNASFHQGFFEIIDIDTLDTSLMQVSDVLQTVVSEFATDFFVHGDSSLQAVKVNMTDRTIKVQAKSVGNTTKSGVESLDRSELSLEVLAGLEGLEVVVSVLEVVELDVSGVNEGSVLQRISHRVLGSQGTIDVAVSFEVTDDFLSDIQITELLNVGLGGEVLDDGELFSEGFLGGIDGFEVFQEVDGVQVTQTSSNVLSVNLVIGSAISSPRAFFAIGSSGGVDLGVSGEEVLKHGARFAGLDVDDHLLVHLVVAHVGQGLDEVISIEISAGEGNEADSTVISKVDEDVVFSSALEDSVATNSLGISLKDSQEVFGGDILL